VRGELAHRRPGDARNRTIQPPRTLSDEVQHQRRDVLGTLTERRDFDREYAEPVEEVLSEAASLDLLLQVAIGRGDDPDIHPARPGLAEALELTLLQHAQQFCLHGHGHLADLVEEERAAISQVEAAGPVG
jgi:hypothetical protein